MHKHYFGNTQKQPTKVMMGVSGFWKNDKPGGFGANFTIQQYTSEELERLFGEEATVKYAQAALKFHGSPEAMITSMKDQLDAWGRLGTANMDMDDIYYATMNIIVLTSCKAIKEDNFNGSLFQYEVKFN